MATTPSAPIETVQTVPAGAEPTVEKTEQQPPPAYADPKRAAVEAKYNELYGQPAEPAISTETALATSTMPGEPVEPAAPAKTVEQIIQEALGGVAQTVAELKTEIATLRQPPVTSTSTDAAKTPRDYLVAGDVDGFERALSERIEAQLRAKMISEASDQSVERVRAEQEVKGFLEQVESQNQDLLPLKDLVIAKAQSKLEGVLQAGQAKTIPQFVTAYKQAVTESVSDVRKVYQGIRGTGKEEGLTIKREVLSSHPLPSTQIVERTEPDAAKQSSEPDVSAESYLARRKAASATGRGLLPR